MAAYDHLHNKFLILINMTELEQNKIKESAGNLQQRDREDRIYIKILAFKKALRII